jgi:hypothetical protein
MLAKIVRPATACRETNYSRDTVESDMTSAAGTILKFWMSSAVGSPEQTVGKSATVEKTATLRRDTSNST